MARLFADENFPLAVVLELRSRGHDVHTALDAGRANQGIPDDEVLEFARQNDRAVLTLNRRHFLRLHRTGHAHAGIVACTQDEDFPALAERIDLALASEPDLENRVVRINRPGPGDIRP
jgi:hypothetical protein